MLFSPFRKLSLDCYSAVGAHGIAHCAACALGLVSAFCGAVALGCSYILAYRDDFLGTDGYAQGTALASVSIDGHFRHRY